MSRFPRATLVAALTTAAVVSLVSSPAARAGDPPAAPAAAAPAAPANASPRLAAVEAEVRAVERLLGLLRRARADLRAGRDDAAPTDAEARGTRDDALRGVREVLRYEAARAKAFGALTSAVEAKDDAKASEAKTALEAADRKLADGLARLESEAAARKDLEKGAKPENAKPESAKPESAKPEKSSDGDKPGRRADKPSSMTADADED